jgi:ribosomal protein S24E
MKVTTQTKNKLLKRDEVVASLVAQGNPGFSKARTLLASTLNVSEERIALQTLKSHFGSNEFTIEAYVYDSVADKERIEPKPKAPKKKEGQ